MARKINSNLKDTLTILGAGVIGAGLALLFAPKSGKRTRRDISLLARSVGTKTDKAVHGLVDDFSDFADTMGHKASDLLHEGRDMTQKSKERVVTAFDAGRDMLEKQKHKISRMIS